MLISENPFDPKKYINHYTINSVSQQKICRD